MEKRKGMPAGFKRAWLPGAPFWAAAVLAASVLLFAACDKESDEKPVTPPTPPSSVAKKITVWFEKPSAWTKAYIYVWDDEYTEYAGAEPGQKLEFEGGWASFSAQAADGYINVRFSDGGVNTTLRVKGIEKDTYYKTDTSIDTGGTIYWYLKEHDSKNFPAGAPVFKAQNTTTKTTELVWDPAPGADAYLLYDKFTNDRWHFQRAFTPAETSFVDDNYGQFNEPFSVVSWKLCAVTYKSTYDPDDSTKFPDWEDVFEKDFSKYYDVITEYNQITVTFPEGSYLSAPQNLQVVGTPEATSVSLKWGAVSGASYYMLWRSSGEDLELCAEVYGTEFVDADNETFKAGTTYSYWVEARVDTDDAFEYGTWSDELKVTLPGLTRSMRVTKTRLTPPAKPVVAQKKSAKGGALAGKVTVTTPADKNKTYKIKVYSPNNKYYSIKKVARAANPPTFSGTGGSPRSQQKNVPSTVEEARAYETSDWSSESEPVITFPTLKITAGTVSTVAGPVTRLVARVHYVKQVSIKVTGWPATGAPTHGYEVVVNTSKTSTTGTIKSGFATSTLRGVDTLTVKADTSAAFYVHIRPKINDTEGSWLVTGKLQ